MERACEKIWGGPSLKRSSTPSAQSLERPAMLGSAHLRPVNMEYFRCPCFLPMEHLHLQEANFTQIAESVLVFFVMPFTMCPVY